jgi:hypothetical protein
MYAMGASTVMARNMKDRKIFHTFVWNLRAFTAAAEASVWWAPPTNQSNDGSGNIPIRWRLIDSQQGSPWEFAK